MKTIKQCAAQGDVIFRKVKALPDGVVEQKEKRVVVAHSETGHHHTAEGGNAALFVIPNNPFVSYLKVSGEYTDVVHHRSFDTHETLRLLSDEGMGETIWEIGRQREHTPEGYRRVED